MKTRSLTARAGALSIMFLTPVTLGASTAMAAESTYDIPVIQSLTGGGAFLGKHEQQALQIEEKVINKSGGIHGHPVHFVFHDDQSTPQVGVQLLNDVLTTHPAIVLGSSLVATCNAMMPLVKNGPVMYCFSAGIHPPAGSYAFTASVSTHDQAHALLRFFRFKGWTRIALMTSTDATGQDADRGFDELLALPEDKDIKVVAREHFNTKDVSVSAQIERIKAAKPQAFIAWSTGSPIATIFRGIVQGGLDVPVGTTGGNMTYAEMTQFAAFLPKQLYLPSSEWPIDGDPHVKVDPGVTQKQKEYYAAYAEDGLKPDEGSVLGWDPANIVVDALRKLPDGVTAAQLHEYLVSLKGQPGVAGVYNFEKTPQRGLSLDNVVVSRWDAKVGRWIVAAEGSGVPVKE
jgi:branched-chain amino acid transport system substrate-binding protein